MKKLLLIWVVLVGLSVSAWAYYCTVDQWCVQRCLNDRGTLEYCQSMCTTCQW